MDFLKDFEKTVSKMEGVTGSSLPPTYFYSSGNYVLNKITSGSYYNCVPQGRILALAGSSGAGKSFIAANLMVSAQLSDAFNLVIDSENALDDDFVSKIGVDVNKDYMYKSVTTISEVSKLVSAFIKGYKKQYNGDPDAKKVHITIDSLDMLLTDSEEENYDKGVTKGDMGQRAKQWKAMLRTFVQSIKGTNITMVITSQVYANQDLLNGEGKWVVNGAVKYSMSQIILIDKLKLKDKNDPKSITGIRMRCEGYKTRFTKPFQKIEIHVPYETGMDPLSGLIEVAVIAGVVSQAGAWYTLVETAEKFQSKNLKDYSNRILHALEANPDLFLNSAPDESDSTPDDTDDVSSKHKRDEKYLELTSPD